MVELASDPDPMLRQRVAVVARHLALDTALGILRRYASDQDPTLRRLANTQPNRLTDTTIH